MAECWYPRRVLPDGRTAGLMPLTFGRARLWVSRRVPGLDDVW